MSDELKGLNVVIFETRHSDTMRQLVALRGGNAVLAPSMKEVPIEANPAAFEFAEELLEGHIDAVILLTGVGTRALLSVIETRYPKEKVLEALKKTLIVPRGPKPIRVLKELGVPYALTVPEPNTWHELLETLDRNESVVPVRGKRVALQEYGVSNEALIGALTDRGAELMIVPVYRWALPDDTGPLKAAVREISEGRADVAVFTTAVQVDHLFRVAKEMGLEAGLRSGLERMAVASVGPDCSEMIRSVGIGVDIEPESPKMGPLVALTAEKAKLILQKKRTEDIAVSSLNSTRGQRGLAPPAPGVFLKACRLERTPYTPVWLMRQAGRYMKEYRAIREKTTFLELCKTPALAAHVTVEAQEKIGADAAIIFSDILLILESFGVGLEYVKGGGPKIKKAVRTGDDVRSLLAIAPEESLSFVFEAIRETKKALKPGIALIGFAGAPFTLASYLIEGGSSKDFKKTKHFMKNDEKAWRTLMEKIVRATAAYLAAQVGAGADALQLFDSWVGHLSEAEYKKYAMPYSREVFEHIPSGVPALHFGTGNSRFIGAFAKAGGDVIGVDHHIRLDTAWKKIGPKKAIQGNLDPEILARRPKEIEKHVKRILKEAGGRPGHIFNLGHGVLPETKVETVIELVRMVKELSRR